MIYKIFDGEMRIYKMYNKTIIDLYFWEDLIFYSNYEEIGILLYECKNYIIDIKISTS